MACLRKSSSILQVRKKCRLRPRRLGRVAQCPPPHFNVRHRVTCSFWGLMSHAKKHRARWLVLEPHGRGFGRVLRITSSPKNTPPVGLAQATSSGPIVLVHPYARRFGNVGFWIPACPLCGGYEHTNTCCPGRAPFDPREAIKRRDGWRGPHCGSQAPSWATIQELCEYQLNLGSTQVRYAPGAQRSRYAGATMEYLRSLGLATSNEVIPSGRPLLWWRWR